MMLHIPEVLTKAQVAELRAALEDGAFAAWRSRFAADRSRGV